MYKEFDMKKIEFKPLIERESLTGKDAIIDPESKAVEINFEIEEKLRRVANSIKLARINGAPVIIAFGAHLIKNGLSKVLISLIKQGFVQHLLGNEAVVIHDWELAFLGRTEENVRKYISQGQFGLWEETGKIINRAVNFGHLKNKGYGEIIGELISEELLENEKIIHQNKEISILAQAYKLKIPCSISASLGTAIHYNHPECDGAAIGATSMRDYRSFVNSISNLQNGVYISIGSAVMSPMVFEKAISAAKNFATQESRNLDNYNIFVNDIQSNDWDWSKGEPPKDKSAYYLRFFKTFNRMGGKSEYIELDNKVFLHNIYHMLK